MKFMGVRSKPQVPPFEGLVSRHVCLELPLRSAPLVSTSKRVGSVWQIACAVWALCAACDATPNPQDIDGALSYMARAIERDDPAALFRVVDERARHAMISIVADRRAAAALVRDAYPAEAQQAALAELGDAATVETAAALFALRCGRTCRESIGARLGAPTSERDEGDVRVVTTTRDGTVRFYRAQPGHWWGFVWQTEALDRERSRANRDLRHIERNAEVYQRRTGLADELIAPLE